MSEASVQQLKMLVAKVRGTNANDDAASENTNEVDASVDNADENSKGNSSKDGKKSDESTSDDSKPKKKSVISSCEFKFLCSLLNDLKFS